ncbi:MAG: site-specific integrase [Pseudomonadota bacterium]
MGSIYKRGEVYWIKYYRNGKSYRESSGSTKKMVAKKLLDRKEGEIAQGKVPSIVFDKVVFDELAKEFITDYRINGNKSLDRAELSVKHLMEEFEGVKVPGITTPRVQQYVAERMKWSCKPCGKKFHYNGESHCPYCGKQPVNPGAANATINRELAALRRILNLGAKQTPPKVNRVPYIPMLKENNIRKGFFEHEQFQALLGAIPEYLKPFVTFGYRTGWRDQEIAQLTWGKNVDLANGIVTLKVGETKNDDARTIYLDDELMALLQNQWEQRKRNKLTPHVFPNKSMNGPIGNFRRAWNKACREAGLGYGYRVNSVYVNKWQDKFAPGPIFHDFRRSAIRNMIRSGVPERVAMMLSGHKTRSVFDRYNIVNDADLKMAAKRQEKYLESLTGTISGTIADFEEKKGQLK